MTNAEYIVNMLMDYMEDEGIEFHRQSLDDGGARMRSSIERDLVCPYACKIPPHIKCCKKLMPGYGNECLQCKYEWLLSEVEK